MRSDIGIDVAAPAATVFALARDVERWATLLPHYARSSVVERRGDGSRIVEFIARRPFVPVLGLGLPVTWRARTWSETTPDGPTLRFVHVAGATRGMDVTWRLAPSPDGAACRVTIEHVFAPAIPGFARFVDRWFTTPIAGRTLATFRALAEAVTAIESTPPPAANP
ncbi:MAG: type II toxin-antitoxin system RatA family toxin [Chloroflexota bacterium]